MGNRRPLGGSRAPGETSAATATRSPGDGNDHRVDLATIELLRWLTDDARARLVNASREIAASRGGAVFRPSDPAAIYVLRRGRVEILLRPQPQAELAIFIRHPREIFGELSLFVGRQVHEARALEKVSALRIDGAALRTALSESPAGMVALTALVASRSVAAEARLAEVGIHSVAERLGLLFERLAAETGIAEARGALIPERLSHEMLGRLVGASRVAINHALKRLIDAGRIAVSSRRIIVRPRDRVD